MAYTITTFSGSKRVSYETFAVTGSCVDHSTGLQTIENVQATVKLAAQAAGAAGYVTCNFAGNTGNVSLYAWDDTGTASNAAANMCVIAVGT